MKITIVKISRFNEFPETRVSSRVIRNIVRREKVVEREKKGGKVAAVFDKTWQRETSVGVETFEQTLSSNEITGAPFSIFSITNLIWFLFSSFPLLSLFFFLFSFLELSDKSQSCQQMYFGYAIVEINFVIRGVIRAPCGTVPLAHQRPFS